MRYAICAAVFALGLAGVHPAYAQAAPGTAAPAAAQQGQMQSMLDRALPEQAAAVQMGIPPAQLNMSQMDMQDIGIAGYANRTGMTNRSRGGTKYKYTPRSPTDVGMPPRLFYNIPKRQ